MELLKVIRTLCKVYGHDYDEVIWMDAKDIRALYEEEIIKDSDTRELKITRQGRIYLAERDPTKKAA